MKYMIYTRKTYMYASDYNVHVRTRIYTTKDINVA